MKKEYRNILWNRILIVLILSLAAAPLSQAQDEDAEKPELTVKSSVDKSVITMGEPLIYSLSIEASEDVSVKLPDPGINLGKFEIRDYTAVPPSKIEGYVKYETRYEITLYYVGEYEIPPVQVNYVDAEGEEKSIRSEPLKIKVTGIAPEDAQDIRDIKNPVLMERDLSKVYYLIGAISGIILAAVAALLYVRYRRRSRLEPVVTEPPVPPDEEALQALQKLKESDLLENSQYKEWFVRFSEIMKKFMGRQFGFPYLERTTEEILDDVHKASVPDVCVQIFTKLLERSDLVKFAKFHPHDEEINETLEMAETLISESKKGMLLHYVKTEGGSTETVKRTEVSSGQ